MERMINHDKQELAVTCQLCLDFRDSCTVKPTLDDHPTRAFFHCHVSEMDTWSIDSSSSCDLCKAHSGGYGTCIPEPEEIQTKSYQTMEFSVCHKNAQYLCFSNPMRKTKHPSTLPCRISPHRNVSRDGWGLRTPAPRLMQQQMQDRRRSAVVVGCAKEGCSTESASKIERELEAEIRPEEGAAWLGVGRQGGKCGEGRGAVELLECLEREAIMGEDEGKQPNNYNRRAQIFYKSSRLFQALKESTSNE